MTGRPQNGRAKTKSPPEGRHCGGSGGKAAFGSTEREGAQKKIFLRPPLFNILTACRKYYTRNCILFEFAVRSAAFLLQIIVFSEKICYT